MALAFRIVDARRHSLVEITRLLWPTGSCSHFRAPTWSASGLGSARRLEFDNPANSAILAAPWPKTLGASAFIY